MACVFQDALPLMLRSAIVASVSGGVSVSLVLGKVSRPALCAGLATSLVALATLAEDLTEAQQEAGPLTKVGPMLGPPFAELRGSASSFSRVLWGATSSRTVSTVVEWQTAAWSSTSACG